MSCKHDSGDFGAPMDEYYMCSECFAEMARKAELADQLAAAVGDWLGGPDDMLTLREWKLWERLIKQIQGAK